MTSQPHTTGQREDAAKKRRDYLLQKAAYKVNYGTLVLSICFFGYLVVASCLGDHRYVANAAWGFCSCGFLVLISLFFIAMLRREETTKLPYVPPVAEQLAALPTEAILVRGSDQPTATAGELLRAVLPGVETKAEELLRAEVRTGE